MFKYTTPPSGLLKTGSSSISSFLQPDDENIDWDTVESFGSEWSIYNSFSEKEIRSLGNDYFDIVPDQLLDGTARVLDAGCGSGRWSKYLSSKVQFIEAIDPSSAVYSAAKLLKNNTNIRITQASIENIPFEDESFDLVFSLGVLHHIPNTQKAIKSCVNKLKPGGYFLVYLYYSLDNRGFTYKFIFKMSTILRRFVSKLPSKIKILICDFIAFFIYLPLIILSKVSEKINLPKKIIESIPLSYYRKTSLHIIRNDALDRFGTPLEQRFSKPEILQMMEKAGLKNIVFSNKAPYWHAIGKK